MLKIPIYNQLLYTYMSTIIINRTKFFNASILPKVDELARKRSCTRSDVLRDIFCTSFRYPRRERTPEQIEAEHELEATVEQERGSKYIVVAVEDSFHEALFRYCNARRGRINKAIEYILAKYLHIPVEDNGFRDNFIRLLCIYSVAQDEGAGEGQVIVKK